MFNLDVELHNTYVSKITLQIKGGYEKSLNYYILLTEVFILKTCAKQ